MRCCVEAGLAKPPPLLPPAPPAHEQLHEQLLRNELTAVETELADVRAASMPRTVERAVCLQSWRVRRDTLPAARAAAALQAADRKAAAADKTEAATDKTAAAADRKAAAAKEASAMQWHTAARNVDAVATKKLLRCEAIEESCEKYAREASTAERIVEQERLIFEQEQKRCLAERDVLCSAMNELDADLDDMWWMVCAVYGVDEARWRMGASGFAGYRPDGMMRHTGV